MKNKLRTLNDSFYWELFWAIVGHDRYTLYNVVHKYWVYTNKEFPVNGIALRKASYIIRVSLYRYSCRKYGEIFTFKDFNAIPFFKNNCSNYVNKQNEIIYKED